MAAVPEIAGKSADFFKRLPGIYYDEISTDLRPAVLPSGIRAPGL